MSVDEHDSTLRRDTSPGGEGKLRGGRTAPDTSVPAGARFEHVRFISAGAGSGKTYRLTQELERALVEDGIAPSRVIGTTFTVKAAGELRERVRERLIRSGRMALAEQSAQALIGTVHSVCERLLKRFAFELGLSPELHVASIEDCGSFFNQALDEALSAAAHDRASSKSGLDARSMNGLAFRLDVDNWRADVKQLADRARDNDISPEALTEMGRRCADDLLAHFPPPSTGDFDTAFLETVVHALAAIDLEYDATTGTAEYYAALKAAAYQLRRPPAPWKVWIGLSTREARKKSEPIAALVRHAASRYAEHPKFLADVRHYIERTYAVAAASLERFQAIKTERGLIDFTDMEQLLLKALDEPAVRARLGAELELLLVDEFQDTNPMQLAIFMKLAELARKVVFVGDVKQAIYGFRGCDPELVRDTLTALIMRGGTADVLERSWRSRPALVHYINSVFAQAFAGVIEPAQITLQPQREEQTDEPAVLRWTIEGKDEERADTLARAIAELVRSGYRIVDRDSGAARAVSWGDIAVLASSNSHVETIAKALRAAHVPMKMTLSGLLSVPEICLAKAALRRLSDPTDTLATAEIIAMTECSTPETWLADRLRWLERESDGYAWGEATHPIVAKLKALRGSTGRESPVEVVARVLNYVGIRDVVTAWGPNAIKAAQRQRNLDALLNLAVEYERHCDSQHLAATLTGFLFWLENPHSAELDLQPVVTTGDAVHVLTYHKSKGLEWPVVIAADFHCAWRPRLWDVRIETDGGAFDVERPLANRAIRFWPQVFGQKSKDLPVLDALRASPEGRACLDKGDAENRRLAYVGLTRARDALVLAVPSRKPPADAWLHTFCGDYLLPEGGPWTLADGTVIETLAVSLDADAGAAQPVPFSPRRLPARAPLESAPRERVNPSDAETRDDATIEEHVELGPRIPLHGSDMTAIGRALHATIAAELNNPGRSDALARSRALQQAYGVDTYVGAEEALAAARRLAEWLEQRFRPQRIWTEYPIVHRLGDGRVVRGWIDVLLETDAGCVIVDHKSSPRPKSEWRDEVRDYAGQLDVYRRALEASGKTVASCWVHFPVGGSVVRVGVPLLR